MIVVLMIAAACILILLMFTGSDRHSGTKLR
jgi:hypothetical protein